MAKIIWLKGCWCRLFGHKRPLEYILHGEAVRCRRCKAEWTVVLLGIIAEHKRLLEAANFYTRANRKG